MSVVDLRLEWPTATEYEDVLHEVAQAQERVDYLSRYRLRRLLDVTVAPSLCDGAPAVTAERLGLLVRFEECLRLDVELLEDHLREIRKLRRAAALDPSLDVPAEAGAS